MNVVVKTDLPYPKREGKVRDIYDLGDELLIVSTDRVSAFDCVLPNGIPNKGACLNQLSLFWFRELGVENHVLAAELGKFPEGLRAHTELEGRSVLAKKASVIPVECIVRGYLAGSGWRSYEKTGEVCGIRLPEGLRKGDRLPEPIFTPSTKADVGHDENITEEEAIKIVGKETYGEIKAKSLDMYNRASEIAEKRGIIICDTKFEFGMIGGKVVVIDEVLTPDSSRFWYKADYAPGKEQKQMDKEYVREYLIGLDWDKKPPAPELPDEVVQETSRRYLQMYKSLTGEELNV